MAKKRKKKLNSKFVAFIALGLAMAMLLAVGREIMTTLQLRKQMAEAKEKLAQTQEENELLVEEKTKLQDPDYVESYARSNYMFSKMENRFSSCQIKQIRKRMSQINDSFFLLVTSIQNIEVA